MPNKKSKSASSAAASGAGDNHDDKPFACDRKNAASLRSSDATKRLTFSVTCKAAA